jgi:hypothetical protein
MSDHKDLTGRDAYVIVEALTFTIEALSGLPIEHRPDNNIADMKRLVNPPSLQDPYVPKWLSKSDHAKLTFAGSDRPAKRWLDKRVDRTQR